MTEPAKMIGRLTMEELQNRFRYHDPVGDQNERYGIIRSTCLNLASLIGEICPDSRERSVSLTKIDEVMFWANASIARNQTPKA